MNGEMATMKRTSLLLIAVFALAMLSTAFGQTAQSQDPNMPSATPTQQTPTSQQPSQTSPSDPVSGSSSDAQHTFVGSIAKSGGKFVLHTSGVDYQLDDQTRAKNFDGKDVKVTGQLDQSSNTIKVQSIEPTSI
jgi:hypothetical protein